MIRRERRLSFSKFLLVAFVAVTAAPAKGADMASLSRETAKEVFRREIPNVPGKSLVSVLVTYAPGAKSPPHRHAGSSFIYAYVLSGAIRSRTGEGAPEVYRAGESWFESPGARHPVSENASDEEPASLLAVFVVDTGEEELTRPDQE
jgi:quercetin dioxygenase-like cupin family protein